MAKGIGGRVRLLRPFFYLSREMTNAQHLDLRIHHADPGKFRRR
ncbi:hypothetical protein EDD55_10675 [Varunaivibrio sulfuroxidans]|uniref:Uncharacterized protein n=1 Tax=Varunaivibrio sulfuroxidans TaxID=1773489 RepID=A0A4R3JBP2_9PROT|nr:hypothetical protein EDD55_10675 [Varunaivibrio sulfuroxidans]